MFDNYLSAKNSLPEGSVIGSTFGYPGEGGYTEFWETPGGERYTIDNGKWFDFAPFTWTVLKLRDSSRSRGPERGVSSLD